MNARLTRRQAFALIAATALVGLGSARASDERPIVNDRDQPREQPAKKNLPTLWIAGDSTVKSSKPMRGWGQDLGSYFDPAKISVVNRAIGGRSSRTFYNEGRWQEILNEIKPGDFVIIQFGHNDVGPIDERGKFRGSVKGIGDETEKLTHADGRIEEVHSYGWYLREFARTAREKQAKVILCSPVPHLKYSPDGKFVHDWKEWRGWVETCAKAERAAFLDLSNLIGCAYDKLDQATVTSYFADKGTHTNALGSNFSASVVVAGLRAIPSAPLDRYLQENGRKIAAITR